MVRKLFTACALACAVAGAALPASAQANPAYGPGNGPGYGPGYGSRPGYDYDRTFSGRRHIQGFVTSFGGFDLLLRIHGGAQPVNLHQGTVLAPLGLTMVPGMLVRCDGYFNGNGLFIAQQIVLIR